MPPPPPPLPLPPLLLHTAAGSGANQNCYESARITTLLCGGPQVEPLDELDTRLAVQATARTSSATRTASSTASERQLQRALSSTTSLSRGLASVRQPPLPCFFLSPFFIALLQSNLCLSHVLRCAIQASMTSRSPGRFKKEMNRSTGRDPKETIAAAMGNADRLARLRTGSRS